MPVGFLGTDGTDANGNHVLPVNGGYSSSATGQYQSGSYQTPVNSPQLSFLSQVGQYANQLAQQTYQWAQGEYQKGSQLTDQTVQNMLDVAGKAMGLSDTLTDQYENLFLPENAQLIQDANSYASPDRLKVNMGEAGATQAQAGQAAMDNATQALQAYGIDPSSGRYAALDKAMAVSNAANVAGAENEQRRSDIATGQNLRWQAIQAGMAMPAAIINANNTATQANSAAVNAKLASLNTGANLMNLPNNYLQTAMRVPQPELASTSYNKGSSSGSGGGSRGGGGSSGPGGVAGAGNGGGGNGGAAWMPAHGVDGGGGASMSSYNFGGTQTGTGSGWGGQDAFQYNDGNPWGGDDYNTYGGSTWDPNQTWTDTSGDQYGTYNGGDLSGYGGASGYGQYYDPGANNYGADFSSGWGDYSTPDSSAFDNGGSSAYQDYGYSGGSYDGGSDYYDDGSSGGDWSFAKGGPVPPSQGGIPEGRMVPPQASPSRGANTDDVRANVNVGEFIIPKDVVMWKGQEFFQNLIAQSKKRRATAPAKGTPGPANPGAPTFSSQG